MLAVQPSQPDASGPICTIILATDLTPASSAATRQAIDLARQLRARLLVVHVIDPGRASRLLGRTIRPVEERIERTESASYVVQQARAAGAVANFLIWDGDASDGILAAADAERADLIVVGSRGRSGIGRYLLGSISDEIVQRAECPVLVVRPDG